MKDELKLYNEAKEAYYNGNPIMTDLEFDELERELGLENKSYVGTRHNPSYTIKHPFFMGSLSKVQVKEDKNGNVDWDTVLSNIQKFIDKQHQLILTPKYDGCSFEAVIHYNTVSKNIVSISSRGDGKWGKDLKPQLHKLIERNIENLSTKNNFYETTKLENCDLVLRGEVLISKENFEKYASDNYVNTRAFVAGILGRDYSEDKEYQDMLNLLEVRIYDTRIIKDEHLYDLDWNNFNGIKDTPEYSMIIYNELNEVKFKNIYNDFDNFRKHICKFSLDGFVIKPTEKYRKDNSNQPRPKDCVAVKFIPQLNETKVTSITWNLGKTGELIPIINVEPVEMDGKMISKCSGHNYGYIVDNKIGKDTKVILSLAGDIIPFLYKVTNSDNFNGVNIPEEYETYIDGCHLMTILSEEDKAKRKFINSVTSLNIPTLGPANAKELFEYCYKNNGETDDFFGESTGKLIDNILFLTPEEVYFGIGGGKSGSNAQKAYKKILEEITLIDIIKTCNFKLCGEKAAIQIEKFLTGQSYDFNHLPSISYEWSMNKMSENYKYILKILNHLGRTFEDFKEISIEKTKDDADKIPVILTGEPNNFNSKSEFLKYNPQYRMTGSWKEVKIVFTNSLESKTGKMKKAIEKGIEIRLY